MGAGGSRAATTRDAPSRFRLRSAPLPSPAPSAGRGRTGLGGRVQREGAACLDDRDNPAPAGPGGTHSRPAAARHGHSSRRRREGRRGETLSRGLSCSSPGQPAPARSGPREPLGSARLQVWPLRTPHRPMQQMRLQNKRERRGIAPALIPPPRHPGVAARHMTAATRRGKHAPACVPPRAPLPTRAPGLRLPTGRGTAQGRANLGVWGGAMGECGPRQRWGGGDRG